MFRMHQVELAPFRGGERTEDGVVGQWLASAEASFAILNDGVHTGDIFQDFRRHLLRWHSARLHPFRGLASMRKISDTNHDKALPAHAAAVGTGAGNAGIKATLHSLDGDRKSTRLN